MSPIVRKEEGAIYFLTDARSDKVTDIQGQSTVQLTFSNESANDYLFIEGNAQVSNDRAKIKDVWTPFAKAFWESENDPKIRLIVVSPSHAEFWDGPGAIMATAKMLFASVTGKKPDMGDNRETGM
ncbi:general stress protein 26 [Brucella pseudogrignonensis]|uniref:General stress protein 26 n=2 Tax=Brucella pseudogrignonensis TaxID=419475 RepID=A0ABU1MBW4_9HYPH|nr:general stress protein 26 [Brucella pseudogrignonensis]